MLENLTEVFPWGEFHPEDIVTVCTLSGNFKGHIDRLLTLEDLTEFLVFTETESKEQLVIRVSHITTIRGEYYYSEKEEPFWWELAV